MPAGDAGLERQALASDYGADGRPRRMSVSVETWQAQQAVVDAARWIEAVDHGVCYPDLAHALHAFDKAQAAQPEGKQAR